MAQQFNDDDDNLDNWDPMMETYLLPENTIAIDNSNPVTFFTGKSLPLDAKLGNHTICDHYMKFGKCADGKYCDRLHIPDAKRQQIIQIQNQVQEGKTRNRLNYTYLSPQLYEPHPDKLFMVTVSNVKSPSCFHFVVPFENYDLSLVDESEVEFFKNHALSKSDISRKLQKCSDMLEDMFGMTYRCDNINEPLQPAQVVACKEPDGRFRRALVISLPDILQDNYESKISYYKLYLLDIGVEAFYTRESIYDIKAHCLSDPPMAVPSTLGLEPAYPEGPNGWPKDAIEYFKMLVLGDNNQYLLCKIMEDRLDLDSPIEGYRVELFDLNTRQNIADRMISNGFANKKSK